MSSAASLASSRVSLKLCVVILSGKLGARHSVPQEAIVHRATSLVGGLGSAKLETSTAWGEALRRQWQGTDSGARRHQLLT